jgi:hypothetical protein
MLTIEGYYECKGFSPDLLVGEGRSDNYAYLVVDEKSKDAVIIDPANPDEYGLINITDSSMMLKS